MAEKATQARGGRRNIIINIGINSNFATTIGYQLEQIKEAAVSVQMYVPRLAIFFSRLISAFFFYCLCRCAEHQKCITDDVLQLSKLRANKLAFSNNFLLPRDLSNAVVRMFSVQAAKKGLIISQSYPGIFQTILSY